MLKVPSPTVLLVELCFYGCLYPFLLFFITIKHVAILWKIYFSFSIRDYILYIYLSLIRLLGNWHFFSGGEGIKSLKCEFLPPASKRKKEQFRRMVMTLPSKQLLFPRCTRIWKRIVRGRAQQPQASGYTHNPFVWAGNSPPLKLSKAQNPSE